MRQHSGAEGIALQVVNGEVLGFGLHLEVGPCEMLRHQPIDRVVPHALGMGPQIPHFQAVGTGGLELALVSAQPGTGYSTLGGFFHVFVTIDKPGVAKNVNITEYGNHSRVTVNQGDQLQIRLDNTVGSKYTWEVMPISDNIVQLIQPAAAAPSRKPKKKAKPGSEEDVTFQFQALNPGQTTLRFLYRNATDNGAPPKRDFELLVEVPKPPK